MSCEPTLAGMWTKSEEVSKSQGSSESSFSTKVKRRAEAKLKKTLAISSFKQEKEFQTRVQKKKIFWECFWEVKQTCRTCFVKKIFCLKILENFLYCR